MRPLGTITLFCVVNGEAVPKAFEVEAMPTKTIAGLKDFIKAKKSPRFDDIAADELTLWKVLIPVVAADKHKAISLSELEFAKDELLPTTGISKLSPECPLGDTIHIIVHRPPPGSRDGAYFPQVRIHCFFYPH